MSENWAIGLVVFCLTQAAAVISAGIIAFIVLLNKLSDSKVEAEHRFTLLEAKCEKWFVFAGTAALHSPTDHLGADKELERFVMLYKHYNHDLPADEWVHYHGVFSKFMSNPNATPNERLCFQGYKELCEHKMTRDGLLNKTLENKAEEK